MKPPRLIPEMPFPPYVFIPGENPHPKKTGGHMEGEKDPVAEIIRRDHPEANAFFRFAIDLYNYGYCWESHVYFEALWNAHGRQGSEADFLKGMIKLGAAGVKLQIKQTASAKDHFLRAQELFSSVKANEGKAFLGFDLDELIQHIDEALSSTGKQLQLIPRWSSQVFDSGL